MHYESCIGCSTSPVHDGGVCTSDIAYRSWLVLRQLQPAASQRGPAQATKPTSRKRIPRGLRLAPFLATGCWLVGWLAGWLVGWSVGRLDCPTPPPRPRTFCASGCAFITMACLCGCMLVEEYPRVLCLPNPRYRPHFEKQLSGVENRQYRSFAPHVHFSQQNVASRPRLCANEPLVCCEFS